MWGAALAGFIVGVVSLAVMQFISGDRRGWDQ